MVPKLLCPRELYLCAERMWAGKARCGIAVVKEFRQIGEDVYTVGVFFCFFPFVCFVFLFWGDVCSFCFVVCLFVCFFRPDERRSALYLLCALTFLFLNALPEVTPRGWQDVPPHFTYPLTARVVRTPQMISQPVSPIFLYSPLPSGTWRTHSRPVLSLMLSSHLFFCLPCLCLATWF